MNLENRNNLYPIFLKVHQLNVLIVGGGTVALEKLSFLLKSSPNANVKVVSISFDKELQKLAQEHRVELISDIYKAKYLEDQHIVIGATNDHKTNQQIYIDATINNILVNIADTPDLCDFYLGGIVTKGNVKIAISTNGKSPTMAKRLRQFFEDVLPESIDDLVLNLNQYRSNIKGNFREKVNSLNKLTKSIIYN
ncbi:precorrin-2 dehydrogenase/sirohydrochlorin ferrochelatase family protein [Pseudofulvibacter geojedonensis]|uniref:precorrin-2 dehydrogenase n=1 Tax=Pseudofulvibacter geojedonensis TaxID=1123758 RepID=A0ABW3I4U4_9FLAO